MKRTGVGCLFLLLIFGLICSLFLNVLTFGGIEDMPTAEKKTFTKSFSSGESSNTSQILVLDLQGPIANMAGSGGLFAAVGIDPDRVKTALKQALSDEKIKAIVLRVNTPGGEVTASDTVYHYVKEAAKQKPVVVYMDSMATSGGYYLSCGASHVVANETTLTGSIGVVIQTLNYSEAFDRVGLQAMTFVSGQYKDSLNGARLMREDEKQYIQSLVSEMYEKFVGIVAQSRGLDVNQLKSGVADGRVITGVEALKHKLVDELGYLETAIASAERLAGVEGAAVVKFDQIQSFKSLLLGAQSRLQNSSKIELSLKPFNGVELKPGTLYLMPSHLAP